MRTLILMHYFLDGIRNYVEDVEDVDDRRYHHEQATLLKDPFILKWIASLFKPKPKPKPEEKKCYLPSKYFYVRARIKVIVNLTKLYPCYGKNEDFYAWFSSNRIRSPY